MFNSLKNKFNNIPQTVKVSTAYAVCSILQRCLSFFTMPLFARLLSEEQYGLYIVYQSWAGILTIFITLNLAYGSFSKAMVKFEHDRDGYIASVQGICFVLSVVFLLIYLPLSKCWNLLFELPTSLICVMVAEIVSSTSILLWSGKKRFEFKYKSVVAVTLLMSFASPILAFFLVTNTENKGEARIIGYAFITIAFGVVFFVINCIRGKKIFNKEYWKYGLGFNIPLLAYYLSQVIFNQSDRIMIDHMVSREKADLYGVAYSVAMLLTFVLNAINNSYVPWFYQTIKNKETEKNKRVSLLISILIAFLLCGVIWFAPEIIYIIGDNTYTEAVYVVPPVAVSLLLLFFSQLFINVEFYYEEKKKLVYASLFAAIFNIASNLVFIPVFGYVAAAYTTLVSYLIFAFSNYIAMKKVLKENKIEDTAYDYKKLLLVLLALVFCAFIGVVLYPLFWIRVLVALVVLIIILLKRKTLFGFWRIIANKGK